ncbi:MAG: hypothetical protein IJ068_07640 [Bacilli bacterium]|nr:hypothetical protein [Bacilli bacterium]
MNNLREFINSKKLKINYIDNKLNIVNFDEIILLTDTKIILLKDTKTITIKGSDLSLLKLLDFEILIGGCIKIIEL